MTYYGPSKTYSVFIKYPSNISLAVIEQLLNACGSLKEYKTTSSSKAIPNPLSPISLLPREPVKVQPLSKYSFGFAEYFGIQAVAVAVRELKNVYLLNAEEELESIFVRLDKKTEDLLEAGGIDKTFEDSSVVEKIKEIVANHSGEYRLSNDTTSKTYHGQPSSTIAQQNSSSYNQNYRHQLQQQQQQQQHSHHDLARERQAALDEIERYKDFKSKQRNSLHNAYLERLSKWESREEFKRDQRRKDEDYELALKDRLDKRRLEKPEDDDDENDLWYVDRDRWIKERQKSSERERFADNKDRNREYRELKDKERRSSNGMVLNPDSETASNKDNFDDAEGSIISQESSNINTNQMNVQFDSNTVVTKPSEEIPSEITYNSLKRDLGVLLKSRLRFLNPFVSTGDRYSHLFDYVKNNNQKFSADSDCISVVLEPLIKKKIVSFLGEEEQELCDFVKDCYKLGNDELSDPFTTLDEIKDAFGDDSAAEDLVTDLWREIVWYCEKKRMLGPRKLICEPDESIVTLRIEECI